MMKFETKIATLLMCTTLALLSSCNKKLPDTPVQEQQVPVGFRAMSQAVWVKSGETDPDKPKFSDIHDDFGVWGIARQEGIQSPYVLWSSNALTKVEELTTDPGIYAPVTAAYWIKDYKYNFLAVAPFEDAGLTLNGITTKETQASATPPVQNPVDFMTITYDMSNKYTAGLYTFDLLGAAAETQKIESGHKDSQQLMFWHLFSQIEIKNIGFATGINGTVTKVVFKAFPSGQYTISYDNSATNKTATTGVTCAAIDNIDAVKAELTFNNPNFSSSSTRPLFNIIPQAVQNFELYIDFTINEGSSTAQYQGFKIDLTSQDLTEYEYNGKYNWDITIGTKNAVSFNVVQINDWNTGTTPDEIPLQ